MKTKRSGSYEQRQFELLMLEFHTIAGKFSTPSRGTELFCVPPYTLYFSAEKSIC